MSPDKVGGGGGGGGRGEGRKGTVQCVEID